MRSRWAETALPTSGGTDGRGADQSGQKGNVTAEFAAAMPAIILVLSCCLGAIHVVGEQVRLADAAADAARALARGDDEQRARALVGELVPGASLGVTHRGEFVCARVSADAGGSSLAAFGVSIDASSCALAGGL